MQARLSGETTRPGDATTRAPSRVAWPENIALTVWPELELHELMAELSLVADVVTKVKQVVL